MVEGLAGGQQEEGPAGLPEGPPKGPQRLPPPALEQAPLLQQLDLGSRHRVSAVRSSNTGAGAREGVGTWRRSGTLPGTVGRGPGLGSLCSCRPFLWSLHARRKQATRPATRSFLSAMAILLLHPRVVPSPARVPAVRRRLGEGASQSAKPASCPPPPSSPDAAASRPAAEAPAGGRAQTDMWTLLELVARRTVAEGSWWLCRMCGDGEDCGLRAGSDGALRPCSRRSGCWFGAHHARTPPTRSTASELQPGLRRHVGWTTALPQPSPAGHIPWPPT